MASKKKAPPIRGSAEAPSAGKNAWDGLPGSLEPEELPSGVISVVPVNTAESLTSTSVDDFGDQDEDGVIVHKALDADAPQKNGIKEPHPPVRAFLGESEPDGQKAELPEESPKPEKMGAVVEVAFSEEAVAFSEEVAVAEAAYHVRTQELMAGYLQQALLTLAEQHENALRLLGERYQIESAVVATPNIDRVVVAPPNGYTPVAPPSFQAPSLRLESGNPRDNLMIGKGETIVSLQAPRASRQTRVSRQESQNTQHTYGTDFIHEDTEQKRRHTLLDVWISEDAGQGGHLANGCSRHKSAISINKESLGLPQAAADDDIEEGRHLESNSQMQRFVIHPYNPIRGAWDVGSLFLVIYDMVMIPMGFFELPETTPIVFMTWTTRLFWSLDMPMSFLTGFITVEGNIDLRPRSILRRYMRSWFGLDALVVGVDWLELLASAAAESLGFARFTKASRVFRILRMIRLLRLARMTEVLTFLTERVDSEKLVIAIDVLKLLILMLGVGHLVACLFYAVGNSAGNNQNWLDQEGYKDASYEAKYLMSLRWSMSQFSGGMDEVVPYSIMENLFALIVFLISFWSGAVFISILTSSMTQWYMLGSQIQQQLTTLRRYLSQNGISKKLALRVQRNAQHSLAEQQRTMPEEAVQLIHQVSEPLRVELHFEMFSPVLSIHPFLHTYMEECPHVARKICHLAMKRADSSPGDIIFSVGEIPAKPKMFLIGDGHLEYKGFDGLGVNLEGGEWVAEACLWVKWTHRGTLRAISDARIFTIDAKEFQTICGQFEHIGGFDPRTYAAAFADNLNLMSETTDLHVDFEWGGETVKSQAHHTLQKKAMEKIQKLKREKSKSNIGTGSTNVASMKSKGSSDPED
jgi:hypothetical protein